MRDFKFRAWDKEKKAMLEPSSINWKNGQLWVCDSHGDNKIEYELINPTAELMQYTSLKDKNKKEIYEGDIVRTQNETEYDTEPLDEAVYFGGGAFYPVSTAPSEAWEVIGNIYENPELLKVEVINN